MTYNQAVRMVTTNEKIQIAVHNLITTFTSMMLWIDKIRGWLALAIVLCMVALSLL